MYKNPNDIREDKIDITGKRWDDDDVAALATKQFVLFNKLADYWRPIIERGRTFENRFEGNILGEMEKAIYKEVEDKIVLEPPVAKAPIRALVGQALKSRKSGRVTTERSAGSEMPDNKEELETINAVLKDMEVKTKEGFCIADAVTSAFVSCYWNVIMFDMDSPANNPDGMRYKMRVLPWDSCLFGPSTIRKPDGSDIKELFYFDYRSIADLIDNYPDMEKQINDHFDVGDAVDSKMMASLRNWDGDITADERDRMFDIIENAAKSSASDTGMIKVIMRLFPIKRKEEVWININDDTGETFEIRPPTWTEEEWEKWQHENPTYVGPYERETIILWTTVFTTSGLVLYNGPHWFQENGMLPCSFWLGDVSGGQPTGPMADMSDDVLANCVAEIEYLDDLRKGSGRLLVMREGALVADSVENLPAEASKSLGVAFISKDHVGPIGDALHEVVRRPNDHWKTYAEQRKGAIAENTRINETMLGAHAPRQSAIAKEAEIGQALTVNARYIDNLNRCAEYHQNLKLKLIAYFYTDHETIEVLDGESGDKHAVELNVPAEYDMEGNVVSVVNDLTAHRYRWKMSVVDDSETAKSGQVEEMLHFLNSAAGPLASADPSGTLLAETMLQTDNVIMKKAGKKLLETAQQMAQAHQAEEQRKATVDDTVRLARAKADLIRSEKLGTQLAFRAESLADYPQLFELYQALQGLFSDKARAEMQEAQQLAQPAPDPQQMGAEEMMAQAQGGM